MRSPLLLTGLGLVLSAPLAQAQLVDVSIRGEVEFNLVSTGPLAAVTPLTPVEIRLQLDATDFVNSGVFPTRGYRIVDGSFEFDLGAGTLNLQSPFPGGNPYFTIRDNDPAVDGFFLSDNLSSPSGLPLNLAGGFGQFIANFSVTYGGATLPSLDIMDALGTYDFTGLTVFNYTIDDGPFNPVGMIFESMEISMVGGPACGFTTYGVGAGASNVLDLVGTGTPSAGGLVEALVTNPGLSPTLLGLSRAQAAIPLFAGQLLVDPTQQIGPLFTMTPGPGGSSASIVFPANPALAGFTAYLQAFGPDLSQPEGLALSNGLEAKLCP